MHAVEQKAHEILKIAGVIDAVVFAGGSLEAKDAKVTSEMPYV